MRLLLALAFTKQKSADQLYTANKNNKYTQSFCIES